LGSGLLIDEEPVSAPMRSCPSSSLACLGNAIRRAASAARRSATLEALFDVRPARPACTHFMEALPGPRLRESDERCGSRGNSLTSSGGGHETYGYPDIPFHPLIRRIPSPDRHRCCLLPPRRTACTISFHSSRKAGQ